MRKELFYLGVILIAILACISVLFETVHPKYGVDELQMQSATFVEHMDNTTSTPVQNAVQMNEAATIQEAQQDGTTVLQQGVLAAKTFGQNIKRDIMGE